jgi:hypothetical protein
LNEGGGNGAMIIFLSFFRLKEGWTCYDLKASKVDQKAYKYSRVMMKCGGYLWNNTEMKVVGS